MSAHYVIANNLAWYFVTLITEIFKLPTVFFSSGEMSQNLLLKYDLLTIYVEIIASWNISLYLSILVIIIPELILCFFFICN